MGTDDVAKPRSVFGKILRVSLVLFASLVGIYYSRAWLFEVSALQGHSEAKAEMFRLKTQVAELLSKQVTTTSALTGVEAARRSPECVAAYQECVAAYQEECVAAYQEAKAAFKAEVDKLKAELQSKQVTTTAEVSAIECVAYHGTLVGQPACCGQSGTVDNHFYICPMTYPTCRDYVAGRHFGRCRKASKFVQSVSLKAPQAVRPMPMVGLGTCCRASAKGPLLVSTVQAYLGGGGRLIDTAFMYENHIDIRDALRMSSAVLPEDVWITDKLRGEQMGFDNARAAIDQSLLELGRSDGRIDLMLIHGPRERALNVDTWKALIDAQFAGKVVHIGVSNFDKQQIEEIIDATGVTPANNQIEFSPLSSKDVKEFVKWMQEKGIVVTAYGSLGHDGNAAFLPYMVKNIQEKHGKSAAQILLRWAVQKNVAVVPGASSLGHNRENLDIFDFELTGEDMLALDELEMPEKWRSFRR